MRRKRPLATQGLRDEWQRPAGALAEAMEALYLPWAGPMEWERGGGINVVERSPVMLKSILTARGAIAAR